jgi:hypothetical protein
MFNLLWQTRPESEFHDFKKTLDLNNPHQVANLALLMAALHNNLGGYVVFGVDNKTYELCEFIPGREWDNKYLRDKLTRYVSHKVEFEYRHIESTDTGLLWVSKHEKWPVPLQDGLNKAERFQIYRRVPGENMALGNSSGVWQQYLDEWDKRTGPVLHFSIADSHGRTVTESTVRPRLISNPSAKETRNHLSAVKRLLFRNLRIPLQRKGIIGAIFEEKRSKAERWLRYYEQEYLPTEVEYQQQVARCCPMRFQIGNVGGAPATNVVCTLTPESPCQLTVLSWISDGPRMGSPPMDDELGPADWYLTVSPNRPFHRPLRNLVGNIDHGPGRDSISVKVDRLQHHSAEQKLETLYLAVTDDEQQHTVEIQYRIVADQTPVPIEGTLTVRVKPTTGEYVFPKPSIVNDSGEVQDSKS